MPNVITTSASNAQPSSVGTDVGVNATKVAVTVQSAASADVVYGFDCDAAPQPLVVKPLNRYPDVGVAWQTLVPLTPVKGVQLTVPAPSGLATPVATGSDSKFANAARYGAGFPAKSTLVNTTGAGEPTQR